MGYMGIYYHIPEAIFYLLKGTISPKPPGRHNSPKVLEVLVLANNNPFMRFRADNGKHIVTRLPDNTEPRGLAIANYMAVSQN